MHFVHQDFFPDFFSHSLLYLSHSIPGYLPIHTLLYFTWPYFFTALLFVPPNIFDCVLLKAKPTVHFFHSQSAFMPLKASPFNKQEKFLFYLLMLYSLAITNYTNMYNFFFLFSGGS